MSDFNSAMEEAKRLAGETGEAVEHVVGQNLSDLIAQARTTLDNLESAAARTHPAVPDTVPVTEGVISSLMNELETVVRKHLAGASLPSVPAAMAAPTVDSEPQPTGTPAGVESGGVRVDDQRETNTAPPDEGISVVHES